MVDANKDVICTYKIMDADCMTNSEVRREIEDKFNIDSYCDNKIELLYKLDNYYVAQIKTAYRKV